MLEIQQNNIHKNYSSLKIENFLEKYFKIDKNFQISRIIFQDRGPLKEI